MSRLVREFKVTMELYLPSICRWIDMEKTHGNVHCVGGEGGGEGGGRPGTIGDEDLERDCGFAREMVLLLNYNTVNYTGSAPSSLGVFFLHNKLAIQS
jgi:hypothetical protein